MLALLVACSTAPPPVAPPLPKRDPDILGEWRSACTPEPRGGYTEVITFGDQDWALDRAHFTDARCETAFYTDHLEGSYSVTGKSATATGAWEVEYGLTEKTQQPFTDDAVAWLEAQCPEVSYLRGHTTAILEKGCASLGEKPITRCATRYDLVAVTAGRLHRGQARPEMDNCTSPGRPDALDDRGADRQD